MLVWGEFMSEGNVESSKNFNFEKIKFKKLQFRQKSKSKFKKL